MEEIGILGAGGQANEAMSYISGTKEITFKAVTKDFISESLIDIEKVTEIQKNTPVIAAIGAPGLRKKIIELWEGNTYVNAISNKASIDLSSTIGTGCIIGPGVVITTNSEVGDHCIVNIGATVSHNCKIGNFATISPGANIAGNVEIGEGVFVGVGAVISNGIKIASGAVIGAGAIVINNIEEENSVVVGNPAKTIKINEAWLDEI